MPEISKDKILAGRKAVDAYREAHSRLQPQDSKSSIDHSEISDKMRSGLTSLGFSSVEEVKKASMEAILIDMERCIRHEGECDNCEGREEVRGCEAHCYTVNTTERGRTAVIPDILAEGEATINYFMDYAKTLPPRKKGRINQMLPNCSIESHMIEDPAFDWDWR